MAPGLEWKCQQGCLVAPVTTGLLRDAPLTLMTDATSVVRKATMLMIVTAIVAEGGAGTLWGQGGWVTSPVHFCVALVSKEQNVTPVFFKL